MDSTTVVLLHRHGQPGTGRLDRTKVTIARSFGHARQLASVLSPPG